MWAIDVSSIASHRERCGSADRAAGLQDSEYLSSGSSTAAESAAISDAEASILPIAKEFPLSHWRLIGVRLAEMGRVGFVIALPHHQASAVADAFREGLPTIP